jgi:hypothetical protein
VALAYSASGGFYSAPNKMVLVRDGKLQFFDTFDAFNTDLICWEADYATGGDFVDAKSSVVLAENLYVIYGFLSEEEKVTVTLKYATSDGNYKNAAVCRFMRRVSGESLNGLFLFGSRVYSAYSVASSRGQYYWDKAEFAEAWAIQFPELNVPGLTS